VAPNESDPSNGKISSASPIGRALVDRLPGDVIEVNVPRGIKRLKVIETSAARTSSC
jgi:transcription elongation factor GreA